MTDTKKRNSLKKRLLTKLYSEEVYFAMFPEFNDEPANRPGMISVKEGCASPVWPQSTEYRIVDFYSTYEIDPAHRYGIQAKIGEEWVDLLVYDNGNDIYGKLHAGQWIPLRKTAKWSLESVKKLKDELLGIPRPLKVLEL